MSGNDPFTENAGKCKPEATPLGTQREGQVILNRDHPEMPFPASMPPAARPVEMPAGHSGGVSGTVVRGVVVAAIVIAGLAACWALFVALR